jgi:hypothetical protein
MRSPICYDTATVLHSGLLDFGCGEYCASGACTERLAALVRLVETSCGLKAMSRSPVSVAPGHYSGSCIICGARPLPPSTSTPPARGSAAPPYPLRRGDMHHGPRHRIAGDDCGCPRSGQESGVASVVATRGTVHRRSSLPDPFTLGTQGKGREAGSPSAGDARPASVRAGRSLVWCQCVADGQQVAHTSAVSFPRHRARRSRLPPRPERSEPHALCRRQSAASLAHACCEPRERAHMRAPPRKPDGTRHTETLLSATIT